MKCDLHRHLGGSISTETIAKISGLPHNYICEQMTYGDRERYDYISFLRKFDILNTIEWDYDYISLTIIDIIDNIVNEGIKYAEIKFSVGKYLRYISESIPDIIIWIANRFHQYAIKSGIEIALILALQYESDKGFQSEVANTINNDTVASLISGIDLVGNENYFNLEFYKPIFDTWHAAGKVCIAHVGELPGTAHHVEQAIRILGVDRICHGIAAVGRAGILKLASDTNVAFDIGISSNLCTGVARLKTHPIKQMIDEGFNITIGTDDPIILDTTLDGEYRLLRWITNCTDDEFAKIYNNSCIYSSKNILKYKSCTL